MSKSNVATKSRKVRADRQRRPLVDALDVRLAAAQRFVLGATVVLAGVAIWRPLPDPFMLPKLTAVVLGAVALLTLAGIRAVRAARVTIPVGAPVWIALALLATLILATVTADNVVLAFVGQHSRYAGLLSYLAYLAIFAVALRLYLADSARGLMRALLAAMAVVCAYGLLQVAGLDPYSWRAIRDEPVFSTLGNTNFAAAYVAILAPVAAAVVLFRGWGRGWRIAAGILLALGVGYIVATKATQGPLAAAAGLGVVGAAWLLSRRSVTSAKGPATFPRWLLIGGPVAAFVVVVLLGARLAPDVVNSLGERRQFWQAALGIFADHPVVGTGLDSFRDYFTQYRPAAHAVERGFQATDSTHNLPLGMLSNGGIGLAAAYLAFVGYVGWVLVKGLLTVGRDRVMPLAAFGGMWAAYQVQSLVSLDVPALTVLHFLSAALVLALAAPPAVVGWKLPTAAAARGRLLPGGQGRRLAAAVVAGVLVLGLSATWLGSRPLRADLAAGEGRGLENGEGLPAFDKAVALAPWEAEYRLFQAQSRLDAGQRDGAFQAAITAAELRRGSSKLALGNADIAQRRGEEATVAFWVDQALRRDPNNPLMLDQAAEFVREAGDADRADRLVARAEQLRSRFGE